MAKLLSHSNFYRVGSYSPPEPDFFDPRLELLTTETVVEDGKPKLRSKFIIDDSTNRFDGLKASDFSLANKIMQGVQVDPASCVPSTLLNADYVAYNAMRLSEFNARIKETSNSKN